ILAQKSVPVDTEQSVSQNSTNTKKILLENTKNVSPQILPPSTFTATDWLTYRSDEGGFELKYPKEFSVNTVSVQDISGGSCEGYGCDQIEEWNIGNKEGKINIQIDHDLKNYTFNFFADDSGNYLKYENEKIVACDQKECTTDSISLDSKEINATGENIIKKGRNWQAFVLSDIYGSGKVKLYLIPDTIRNSMIEIRMALDNNLLLEKIVDTLSLLK
ncbi:MAG: hypothetical protein WCG28_03865, partial [bacterium]